MQITSATLRLSAAARPYEREVQRYVCPIYAVAGSKAESIGSGFLLKLESSTILITAAHVLEHARRMYLQIPAGDRAVPIKGDYFMSAKRDRKNDGHFGHDVGFVLLRVGDMIAPPSTPPLTLADLDLRDAPAPETAYGFVGVPSSKNPLRGATFDGSSYFYGGLAAKPNLYKRLGYRPATHFLMRFERERMIGGNGALGSVPKPHGMSGGPVFRIGTFDEIEASVARPRVVAFGIEWQKSASVLVGVRIGLLTDIARQVLPHLADQLPEPVFFQGSASLLR
jgi:hypothetical protein